MKLEYEKIIDANLGTEVIKAIDTEGKVLWIPTDPANSDYQRYLRWLENSNAEESGTLS